MKQGIQERRAMELRLRLLGPELQAREARRSLPMPGFVRWIGQCRLE
jgi:hypothetical protein